MRWCTLVLVGCGYITEADRDARWDVDDDGVERPDDCDDRDPTVGRPAVWYADADHDQFGDDSERLEACVAPDGYVMVAGDCDDTRPSANPAVAELCNDLDDDCDGAIDEGLNKTIWSRDGDGDGFGDDGDVVAACEQPEGYVAATGDCDDLDPMVNPNAVEVCDPLDVDENCDGFVDDPTVEPFDHSTSDWAPDADGDLLGDATAPALDPETCDAPAGWTLDRSDCDDTDPVIPDAVEWCDGVDNDCDGITDEDDAADALVWFSDADEDGYGWGPDSITSCADGVLGRVRNSVDCDDADPGRHPLAAEVCNGIDDNCNLETDDDDPFLVGAPVYYVDLDADGFGDSLTATPSCSVIGVLVGLDCDDGDAARNPGALEACDGVDNDCDGLVDDADNDVDPGSAPPWFVDGDGDGFGSSDLGVVACNRPFGHSANNLDCDDDDRFRFPGAAELCDGLDNDCDGSADEELPTWAPDLDGDGHGDSTDQGLELVQCFPGPGFSTLIDDCDDTLDTVFLGAPELCDGLDNDCDTFVDSDDADGLDTRTWYLDLDGDGFGDPGQDAPSCVMPSPSHVLVGTDCDDANAAVFPGAAEVCNAIDDDCDGNADDTDLDDDVGTAWYADVDGDGYGDDAVFVVSCAAPEPLDFWRAVGGDCDDTLPETSPDAAEVCDGVDNDCDGLVDDADDDLDTSAAPEWWNDGDSDGFGDGGQPWGPSCEQPPGQVGNPDDCDDSDATFYPGAPELCDGEDNDCDTLADETIPTWYEDLDQDGWGTTNATLMQCSAPGPAWALFDGDCQDTVPEVNPGATEVCNGGIDDDCDLIVDDVDPDVTEPVWYADTDGDGAGDPGAPTVACVQPPLTSPDPTDCDDSDALVSPTGVEVCDTIDNDCDGAVDADDLDAGTVLDTFFYDGDGDGFGDSAVAISACEPDFGYLGGAGDCDDADFKVKPGADEVCDTRDNDCDGLVDDADPGLIDGPCFDPPDTGMPPLDTGLDLFPLAACRVTPEVGDPTTVFTLDASASGDPEGQALDARFVPGDGGPPTAFAPALTTTHTYAAAGTYEVTCEVRDPGGQVARALATVVVADPARWLVVDSTGDDNDAEVYGPPPYLGGSLSLREAITLANGNVGPDTISFASSVGTVFATSPLPVVTDDNLTLVGDGVVIDGSAAGLNANGLSVDAQNFVATGVDVFDWSQYAIYLQVGSTGSTIRDASVRDSWRAIRVNSVSQVGPGLVATGSTGTSQIEVYAAADIRGAVVRGGSGDGIAVKGSGAGVTIALATILDNAGHGVFLENPAGGADDVRVIDSTIVLNGGSGVAAGGANVTGTEVRNTVLAYNGEWGLDLDPGHLDAASPDFNAFFANGSGSCSGCVLGLDDLDGVDPLLVDVVTEPADVCPLPDSPVIDAGTDLTFTDRNGWETGAFDGAAPDIGACERP